jgi:hypothetical protein
MELQTCHGGLLICDSSWLRHPRTSHGDTVGCGRYSRGMQQTRAAPPGTLEAVLERITYANQETGYTVARVATNRSSDLLTVVGPLLGVQPGESLRLRGRWVSHPQYGRQFQVEAYDTVLPATIQGIRRYLGSGLIKGIGPGDATPSRSWSPRTGAYSRLVCLYRLGRGR